MSILTLLRSGLFGFVLSGSVLLTGTAWAGTSTLEGVVKDPNGRPVSGADVRIEAKADRNVNTVVKTDAKGNYVSGALPTGTYKVTLVVGGSVKASITNTTIRTGAPTQLNFDLKASSVSRTGSSGKKGTHMVYIPDQTGSHFGGRWVEVDDNGNGPGADNVDKVNGDALRKYQSTQHNPTNSSIRP